MATIKVKLHPPSLEASLVLSTIKSLIIVKLYIKYIMKANVIMLTCLHILRDKLIATKLICTSGKVYVFSTFSLKYLDYIYKYIIFVLDNEESNPRSC